MAVALADGPVDGLEVEYLGRIAERDTRPLTVQVLKGALTGHTEEDVNDVNAPGIAAERGIEVAETRRSEARDFSDLVRVTVVSGSDRTRVVGTVLGSRNRPHLLEAWGSRFNVQLEQHLAVFRYTDQPGMLGRVGTMLGDANVNIVSAAVGWKPDEDAADDAVMVVTADAAIPQDVVDAIARDGRLRRRPHGEPLMHPFRAAVEARDFDAALALFADDATLDSPVAFKPFVGIEQVSVVLRAVVETFEDFHYTDEFATRRHARARLPRPRRRQVGRGPRPDPDGRLRRRSRTSP